MGSMQSDNRNRIVGFLSPRLAGLWLALVLVFGLTVVAVAQSDGPLVAITGVDSEAFPRPVAYVAVADKTGPLTDLDHDNFQVSEEGSPISPDSFTVEMEANLDLRLVLAIDTSTPTETLATIKTAAGALLDKLGPRDRAAVIIFQDAAAVVHGFTNNTEELRAVIAGLSPGGNYTALNQAAFEAIALAGQVSEGRRAVVILTDSRNNTGNRSPEEIINQARTEQTSLWMIGLGSKAPPAVLESMAGQTGGKSYILAGPGQVEATLLAVESLLRQGYRVTFQSGFKADNAGHEFTVAVTGPAGAGPGQAQARFMAVPGPVTITLPGISQQQTIRGVINLSPRITAPGSPAWVEYLLDGQLLARVNTPPYSFEWDSAAAEPGSHHLVVRAADSAGNEGQMEVGIDLAPPLLVNISTPQQEVKVGDQLAIAAQIDSLAEMARVEFLLDGQVIGSAESPPYAFALDSSQYRAGLHVITVRVEDKAGRQAQASLSVRFLPLPPPSSPEPGWGSVIVKAFVILGAGLLVLLVAVGTALVLRGIVARQRRSCRRRYGLVLSNRGNVRSRYELRAEDPARALKFEFSLDGAPLPYRQATGGVEQPAPVLAGPAFEPAGVVAAGNSPAQRPPINGRSAQQTAAQAVKSSNAIADTLNVFVNLLPASLTGSLRGTVGQVRQGQTAVRNVQRTSRQVNKVASLGSVPASPAAPAAPAWTSAAPAVSGEAARPARRPGSVSRLAAVHAWAQTPFVEPGQALEVDIFIDPVKPFQAQECSFAVSSRPLGQEQASPVTEQASLQLPGLPWLRRYLPLFLVGLLALGVMVGIGYGVYGWLNTGAW